MSAIEKSQIKKLQDEFIDQLSAGLTGIALAGQTLVKLLAADPEARGRLMTEFGIAHNTITMLERIGNGQLRPQLAFADSRIRALPIPDQDLVLNGKVDVLVLKPDGEHDVLQVGLLTAPAEIKAQVLSGDHIRPLNEQRAWLVAQANQAQPSEIETVPWRTYGRGGVEVLKAHTVLKRKDILSMLKAIGG